MKEERKLISMVEYIHLMCRDLPNRDSFKCVTEVESKFSEMVVCYANFLQQKLTLGMFVPCDEDGKVLSEPKAEDWSGKWHEEDLRYYWEEDDQYEFDAFAEKTEQYQAAQNRVIFEGFEVHKHDFQREDEIFVYNFPLDLHLLFNGNGMILTIGYENIEKLNYTNDLTLTQSKYDELFK